MDKNLVDTGLVKMVLDKIEKAAGYCSPSREARDAVTQAKASIIREIAQNRELDPLHRLAFVTNTKKYIKEYANQTDILAGAMKKLNATAQPNKVEDDWLADFFEKAGKISDETTKLIWSRILSEEMNNPSKVPRKLLHALFLMEKEEAQGFAKLAKFCLPDSHLQSLYHPFIYMNGNAIAYGQYGVTTNLLDTLENYGLVNCNYDKGYRYRDKKIVLFQNQKVVLRGECIFAGNVLLTKSGNTLMDVIESEADIGVFTFITSQWEKLGVSFEFIK